MNRCGPDCGFCGRCTSADEPRDPQDDCWFCGVKWDAPHEPDCELAECDPVIVAPETTRERG